MRHPTHSMLRGRPPPCTSPHGRGHSILIDNLPERSPVRSSGSADQEMAGLCGRGRPARRIVLAKLGKVPSNLIRKAKVVGADLPTPQTLEANERERVLLRGAASPGRAVQTRRHRVGQEPLGRQRAEGPTPRG